MEEFDMQRIAHRVDLLRKRYMERDARLADVRAVRHGDFEKVAPDLFTNDFPRPVVANLIDSSARHAAAALAPMPNISCSSSSMLSKSAKAFADKRTKIVKAYYKFSKFASQMQRGADQFFTYGMITACVEPDFKAMLPRITIEDSAGVYPVWDRTGRTVEVARVTYQDGIELQAQYPEHAKTIEQVASPFDGKVEVVKYVSDTDIVLYLPKAKNEVLSRMANPIGRCYYVCRAKPGLDDEIRGNFDDLIWVQIARHRFQMLALEAADKAVRAPLVVPPDVGEVPLGPDAIIRTQQGIQGVGRLPLDVPAQTWLSIEHLRQEMQAGSITPEALDGSIDASVITGRGVQELAAGFSQQIAAAQDTLASWHEELAELCFYMDETIWPDETKTVRGQDEGVPYSLDYKPSRDIRGDYTVDVSYGFLAGMDPNRALVYLLQAQTSGLVSDDYVRRNLPAGINAVEEAQKVMVEAMEKSTIQALSALAQSLPQLVANGMDPTPIVVGIARATSMLRDGKSVDVVMQEVFAPEPPPAPEGSATTPGAPGAEAGGEASGFGPEGLPSQLGLDMATEGPNARPDLQILFAGMNASGNPVVQGGVSRYVPVQS